MKIFVKTFGCSANMAEGEMLKGILSRHFEITDISKEADIIILNICTVKGENNALKEIRKAKDAIKDSPEKKIIVSGCITKDIIAQIQEIDDSISLISTHNIHHIIEVVEETINNNPIMILAVEDEEKINLPRVKHNKVVGIVLISQGCNSKCAYCSVNQIKGKLHSYPVEKIKQETARFVREGCKEVWLTGQDTGCYGDDIGTDLPELLDELASIKGDFMIRLGMANPKYVKNYVDNLIKVLKKNKIFKFLHLPIQSGNDDVLKAMNRGYTVDEFKTIIKKLREAIPDITISTDIICGFPNETDEQFEDSISLVKELNFDILNISRFVPRPGTAAAKLPQIDGGTIKDRSRKLTSTFEWMAFERNKKWVGWSGDVIVEEHGKNNTSVGRNFAYRPIVFPGRYKLGARLTVKVTGYTAFDLRGEFGVI